ncbi:TRAP transporter substrate-binding protein [Mollicutes bacterium LVI A0039]|nr:TRAP transporter substrate-binding protein [Mollicutes bacterium LVI A0039]
MKKIITLLAAFILVLAGCGSSADGTSSQKITIAFNQSESHPQYIALSEFAEKFEEQTEGRYEIDIQANEILGSQKETLEMVQGGTLEMTLVSTSLLENFDDSYVALSLPYVYDSLDHQRTVFSSDAFDELFAKTSTEVGVTPVAAYTAGARNVYTKSPMESAADLSGKKIRVMESQAKVDMMNAMGGVGTPMSQGEVYTAIQQGIIDGGENNEVTFADLKHYEVAPNYYYTEHLMVPDVVVVSNTFFDTMSDSDKEIFNALIEESVTREFELWIEGVEAAKTTATEGGAKFNEIDKTAFQEACFELNEKTLATSEDMTKIYNQIRDLA